MASTRHDHPPQVVHIPEIRSHNQRFEVSGQILLDQKTDQLKRDLDHYFFRTIADARDLPNVSILAGLVKLCAKNQQV
jgi:hypothetical protein